MDSDEEKPKMVNEVPKPDKEPTNDLSGSDSEAIEVEPKNSSRPTGLRLKKIQLLILVVVLAAIASYLVFANNKKSDNHALTNSNQSSSSNSSGTAKSLAGQKPQSIVYAFASGSAPQTFYWRPAAGGNRTEAGKLNAATSINFYAVYGKQVAVATSPDYGSDDKLTIWYSSNSGQSYSKVFEGKAATDSTEGIADQITSMIFASNGKSLVFGYLPTAGGKNTVKQLTLDSSKTVKDLITADKSGVFVKAFNATSQQLVYMEGCYNCDGNITDKLIAADTSKKTSKTLFDGQGTPLTVASTSTASDLLVLKATIDKSITTEGLPGYYIGPPYQLSKVNIISGQERSIATIGQKSFDKTSQTISNTIGFVGYMNDDQTPYYVIDKQLFRIANGKSLLTFEAAKSILGLYYVSDKTIIASSGDYSDFNLTTFDGDSKATNILLNGDSKTHIFGVTTE